MTDTDPLRLRFERFELDAQQARLLREGRPLGLPPKAFGVLCALARQRGQLVLKTALLDTVWGHRYVSDSVLKTTISELRNALGDDVRRPRYIETVPRHGYRFIAAADAVPAPGAEPILLAPTPAPALPRLIGRERARERLHEAWRGALRGHRRLIWVAGEAGIGKTTLIDRFVAELDPRVIAHGQCVEQRGTGEPYLPVLQALAALGVGDPRLKLLMRTVAPTWLLQMPWLEDDAEALDRLRRQLQGTTQDRMLRELGELLDRYTLERPVLLVTEDLHWSDDATLRLIDHVARRRGPARLMWLASFRVAEVIAEDHPLKALRHELRLHKLAEELLLDPFSERDVADYLAARVPTVSFPDSFTRGVHARTDGLPLFVANVVDDLLAQRHSAAGGESRHPLIEDRVAHLQVPENLAGVIERRLARLPADLRALLDAASVCGVEFYAHAVADALGCDVAVVDKRFDELVRRQQWLDAVSVARLPDGSIETRYAFAHALYRQLLYERCGAAACLRLHARVAAFLLARRAGGAAVASSELALHFEAAGDLPSALAHYADAAAGALACFAPNEALHLSGRALALLEPMPSGFARDRLEIGLLERRVVAAARVLGTNSAISREALERLDELDELYPGDVSPELSVGRTWVLAMSGDYAAAYPLAEHKLDRAQTAGDSVRQASALCVLGAVLAQQGRLLEARDRLERAVTLAVETRTPTAPSLVVLDLALMSRGNLAQVLAHLGRADEARRHAAAAHARADELAQPYARHRALTFEAGVELLLDRPERVLSLTASMQGIAAEHAIGLADGSAHWMRGWATARLGHPAGGHALVEKGEELENRRQVMCGLTQVLGLGAQALILARRWPEARSRLEAARAMAERTGERLHLPLLLTLEAHCAVGFGDTARARTSFAAACEEARRQHALPAELAALAGWCDLEGRGSPHEKALVALRRRAVEAAASG